VNAVALATPVAGIDGRVALIIGGAGGIGVASSRALALAGCRVVVADLASANPSAVAVDLPGAGHVGALVDMCEEASVERLFEETEAQLGPIAIMVYVAGGPLLEPGRPVSLAETSIETWQATEALNARGLFLAARAFFRRRTGHPVADGRLITIGSMAGIAPSGLHTGVSYASAKASAINLTRYAALEGAPLGITANAIAPGTIVTDTVRREMTAEHLERTAAATPVGKLGRPENIAAAVAYFASRDADFATGCVLEINGGRHMG